MEKKYFAYFHYEGGWFGFVTEDNDKKQCVNWMLDLTPEYLKRNYDIDFYPIEIKDIITARQAVSIIRKRFPNQIPVRVIEWRQGPRNRKEDGSRPNKGWTHKDYIKNSHVVVY